MWNLSHGRLPDTEDEGVRERGEVQNPCQSVPWHTILAESKRGATLLEELQKPERFGVFRSGHKRDGDFLTLQRGLGDNDVIRRFL
jgi:hypothetical protein